MTQRIEIDLPPIPPGAPATLGGFLEEVASLHPSREAIAFTDALRGGDHVSWTYARLREEARRIARGLIAAGCGKGARIGILLGNRPEFVAALFGVAAAGAVPVTFSTFSTRDELAVLLEQSDVECLLTQRSIARRSLADDLRTLLPDSDGGRITASRFPFLRQVAVLGGDDSGGFTDWNAFIAAGESVTDATLDARQARVSGNDPGVIIFTSGTTSLPKG